ncbi:MAG: protein kinase [Polyangiaceae bacterium]|nr:protein kinase [Polyangiaceae bacterium]
MSASFRIDPHSAPTVPAFPQLGAAGASGEDFLPGEYRLIEKLDQADSFELWKGVDGNGRPLLIKLATSASAEASTAFAAQARVLVSLTHRSVVRLLGHGEARDGRAFLALEWLEGYSLRRLIEERGAGMPPTDAIRLLMPIASALVLAHDRGFVHGGVNADAVFIEVRSDGDVIPKLIDFSTAKRTAPSVPPTPSNLPLAPRSNEPTERVSTSVDIRGFAATIFYAITCRAPFDSRSKRAELVPRTGLSQRDAVLWRILAEGLAPATSARFNTLHAFARELATWAELRGLDADVTGSPISVRWLHATAIQRPERREGKVRS